MLVGTWGEGNPRILRWECILAQKLWKTVQSFLTNLKIQSTNSTPVCIYPKEAQIQKDTHTPRYTHPNVHCSIIYICQDVEVTCVHQG